MWKSPRLPRLQVLFSLLRFPKVKSHNRLNVTTQSIIFYWLTHFSCLYYSELRNCCSITLAFQLRLQLDLIETKLFIRCLHLSIAYYCLTDNKSTPIPVCVWTRYKNRYSFMCIFIYMYLFVVHLYIINTESKTGRHNIFK